MSKQGYFMDNQPIDNRQSEPVAQGATQPPVAKKGRKKLIVAIAIGLVLLVAAIVTVVILSMPSKQDYKDLSDGAFSAVNSYNDLVSQQTNRGMLYVSILSQTSSAVSAGQDTERGIVLLHGEEAVSEIEEKEHKITKTMASNEQFIDEQVSGMNDREIKNAYEQYLQAREKLYGPGVDAEGFGESLALTYRVIYACDQVINPTEFIYTEDRARGYLEYIEDCGRVIKQAESSGTLVDRHESVLGDLASAASKRAEFIENGLVDFDEYDFSVGIEQLTEEQRGKLADPLSLDALMPYEETLTALKDLHSLAGSKQLKAFGSAEDF